MRGECRQQLHATEAAFALAEHASSWECQLRFGSASTRPAAAELVELCVACRSGSVCLDVINQTWSPMFGELRRCRKLPVSLAGSWVISGVLQTSRALHCITGPMRNVSTALMLRQQAPCAERVLLCCCCFLQT